MPVQRTSHIGFHSITSVSSPLVNHLKFIHRVWTINGRLCSILDFTTFSVLELCPSICQRPKNTFSLLTHSSIFVAKLICILFLYARLETGRIMWLGMASIHTGFHTITLVMYIGSLPNMATWFPSGRGRTLFILGSLGQRSRWPLL